MARSMYRNHRRRFCLALLCIYFELLCAGGSDASAASGRSPSLGLVTDSWIQHEDAQAARPLLVGGKPVLLSSLPTHGRSVKAVDAGSAGPVGEAQGAPGQDSVVVTADDVISAADMLQADRVDHNGTDSSQPKAVVFSDDGSITIVGGGPVVPAAAAPPGEDSEDGDDGGTASTGALVVTSQRLGGTADMLASQPPRSPRAPRSPQDSEKNATVQSGVSGALAPVVGPASEGLAAPSAPVTEGQVAPAGGLAGEDAPHAGTGSGNATRTWVQPQRNTTSASASNSHAVTAVVAGAVWEEGGRGAWVGGWVGGPRGEGQGSGGCRGRGGRSEGGAAEEGCQHCDVLGLAVGRDARRRSSRWTACFHWPTCVGCPPPLHLPPLSQARSGVWWGW